LGPNPTHNSFCLQGNTPFIGSNRLHICLWEGGGEEEEDKDEKCKEQMKKQNTGFWFKSYPNKKKGTPSCSQLQKKQSARTSMKKIN
jgi:hypothetical protein